MISSAFLTKNVLILFAILFTASGINAQEKFLADNHSASKKFFVIITSQYQRTGCGDYKVPVPPFGNNPQPVSMEKKSAIHYQFRGDLAYKLSKNIDVTIGIAYSKQGQNYSDYSGTEKDTGTGNTSVLYSFSKSINFNYLNFPLLLHYNTSESKTISFTCYGGIYYGRLIKYIDAYRLRGSNSYGSISQTDTAQGNTYHDIFNVSFPWAYGKGDSKATFTSSPYKSYDIGQMIGVGVQKNLSTDGLFFIMINYQAGFINIKNVDSQYVYANKSYKFWNSFGSLDPNQFITFKNSLIGISLGLKIKI